MAEIMVAPAVRVLYSVFSLIVKRIWLMKSKAILQKYPSVNLFFGIYCFERWKSYSTQNIHMAEIMVALLVHLYSTSIVQFGRALIVSKPVPDRTGQPFQPRGRSGDFPTTT